MDGWLFSSAQTVLLLLLLPPCTGCSTHTQRDVPEMRHPPFCAPPRRQNGYFHARNCLPACLHVGNTPLVPRHIVCQSFIPSRVPALCSGWMVCNPSFFKQKNSKKKKRIQQKKQLENPGRIEVGRPARRLGTDGDSFVAPCCPVDAVAGTTVQRFDRQPDVRNGSGV